jgi:hypothetical protein
MELSAVESNGILMVAETELKLDTEATLKKAEKNQDDKTYEQQDRKKESPLGKNQSLKRTGGITYLRKRATQFNQSREPR